MEILNTSSQNILKELYPSAEKALAKKENQAHVQKMVSDYLDKNNDKLTTLGPMFRTIFSGEDKERLFNILDITPIQIKTTINNSSYIESSWKKIADPFFIACVMGVRYATIKNDNDLRTSFLIYLTLALYPSLHFKYFKFQPIENIMNYTINNLSNKYKIKQMGTMYHALLDTILVSHENEKSDIIRGYDKDFIDYVNSAQARINSMMKNIADEYYKNHKNQNYLNTEEEKNTDDEFRVVDSNIFSVDKTTNQVVLKLLVDGPNIKLIDFSAKLCSVSINELRNYINSMVVGEHREEIKTIIENILFLYLYNEQNRIEEINSNKFMMYCIELYRKSNTTDKNILKIKEILDLWLKRVDIYKKTQRLATINDFRRAIFLFFVFSIQKINA
jgi:hypothetical protein